jgi:hypothetical protein
MYHHWSKHWTWPDRPHHEDRTLLGYWEINGVKAHCLLDSGSEGVLLSPEFMRAMGMKMFALEQPIALQLACIGSRLTINYGTNTPIKFGRKLSDKYFDVANVEYYDPGNAVPQEIGNNPGLRKSRGGANWERDHPNWKDIH